MYSLCLRLESEYNNSHCNHTRSFNIPQFVSVLKLHLHNSEIILDNEELFTKLIQGCFLTQ